jgi:hypothetical protein
MIMVFWRVAGLLLTLLFVLGCSRSPAGETSSAASEATSPSAVLPKVVPETTPHSVVSADSPSTPASETNNAELLETVIRQHTAALEGLRSVYTEITWSEDSVREEKLGADGVKISGGRCTWEGSSKTWQRDGNYHQDSSSRILWHDSGESQENRHIVILNDRYFAMYIGEFKIIDLYHFENRNSLQGYVAQRAKAYPKLNIIEYGYKGGSYRTLDEYFWESTTQNIEAIEWTINREEVDGDRCFRLKFIRDAKGSRYVFDEVLINADRGFLIQDRQSFANGNVVSSFRSDLKEISPGVWFPMAVDSFRAHKQAKLKIKVIEARVNGPIEDAVFTIEKMAIDPSTVAALYEHSPRQRDEQVKLYWSGQWVPKSMVPKNR